MFKKLNKKTIIMIFSVIFISIFIGLTGGIYSVLKEQSEEVLNTFRLGSVSCKVEESFDGNIKENVSVKNTSGVAVFIRSKIIVTWMSSNGESVYSEAPVFDKDYIMEINTDDWFLGTDGYYYFNNEVNSGSNTSALIKEAKVKDGADSPEDFYLSIEIISSAVQAKPSDAVSKVWNTVRYNGTNLEPIS